MDHQKLTGMDLPYALLLSGVFTGVFLLVSVINHFFVGPIRQRRQLQRRLKGQMKEQEVRAQIFKAYQESQGSPLLSVVGRVAGLRKIENLQRILLQSDIYLTPSTFLSVVGILGSIGYILGMVIAGFPGSIGGALVLGLSPVIVLRWKRSRKTLLFEKQMPDAMGLLARSIRAGHTMASTLDLVSQEIPAPLGTEMRITYEEQRLGLSMPQALRRMGERVSSRDLQYFVTAVLIQSETGGNLAEILENIGQIIRDRLMLKGKIRGLTAEGRFSAIILGLLPFVVFGALIMVNRQYIMPLLWDPMGRKIAMVGITSILLGALVMKKMVTIKV